MSSTPRTPGLIGYSHRNQMNLQMVNANIMELVFQSDVSTPEKEDAVWKRVLSELEPTDSRISRSPFSKAGTGIDIKHNFEVIVKMKKGAC